MDWIVTLITAVLSGGAVSLVTAITNRRANKRIAEAEADKAMLDNYQKEADMLHEQILRKDERLLKAEERYNDQTKRLRETQDREVKLQHELTCLTKQVGELELVLSRHKCIKEHCPYKEPATELTHKARKLKGVKPKATTIPKSDPQPELTSK